MTETWKRELLDAAQPKKIKILSSFFKTGKGEYGEGDKFIGLPVPANRAISTRYHEASFEIIAQMLHEDIHEFRLAGLIALVAKFTKEKNQDSRKNIVDFYLKYAERANNWDLVDLSAPKILGEYLLSSPSPTLLDELSVDSCLWRQRIAIVSTLTLIRHNHFDDTLRLASRYLSHPHPLIHKATGWMLREVGKRNPTCLHNFLEQYASQMPRTALRYAIERLDADTRLYYMNKK